MSSCPERVFLTIFTFFFVSFFLLLFFLPVYVFSEADTESNTLSSIKKYGVELELPDEFIEALRETCLEKGGVWDEEALECTLDVQAKNFEIFRTWCLSRGGHIVDDWTCEFDAKITFSGTELCRALGGTWTQGFCKLW